MAAEEEALGKVLDRHLMRRLLSYLRPYRWQVYTALAAIILKAGLDVLGPLFVKIEIDKYLISGARGELNFFERFVDRHLSADPWTGITQICLAYVAALLLSLITEFAQTYLIQRAGQRAITSRKARITPGLRGSPAEIKRRSEPMGRSSVRLARIRYSVGAWQRTLTPSRSTI